MRRIEVELEEGDRFIARVGTHNLLIDQPVADGGTDFGPSPVELFVVSLAGCVGFYAERFLRRHNLPADGVAVDATYEMSTERPARVASVRLDLTVGCELDEGRATALRRVVEHCTLTNTLRDPPQVTVGITERVPERS